MSGPRPQRPDGAAGREGATVDAVRTRHGVRALTENPLKVSPALGAALAFLGIDRAMPLFHGGQGCTAFALVLAVRHFREAIPLQTTAMTDLTSILGGADNVEQALSTLHEKAAPRIIGLCSTALTDTRDDDIAGDLKAIRARHPEWENMDVVFAATPDHAGSLEDGWSRAVTALIQSLVEPVPSTRRLRQVNVLAGSHLTPGDVEAVRDLVESFGLRAIVVPDLAASLDGHVADEFRATSMGGTPADLIAGMGESVLTIAVGEHMRPAAEAIERIAGVPFRVFRGLVGLDAVDAFVASLMEVSGAPPCTWLRRDRSRLIDAMLDGHFYFGGRRAGIAGEPDLVFSLCRFLTELGCRIPVATVATPPSGEQDIAADKVLVGDLGEFEQAAADAGIEIVIGNSHVRDAASRLDVPLIRAGFPVFDRLGAPQRVTVGYRGSRDLIFDIANLFLQLEHGEHGGPQRPAHEEKTDGTARHAAAQAR